MISPVFAYPTSTRVQELERERSHQLDANSLGAQILPAVDLDTATVMWEIRDNTTGLMHARTEGEPFPLIQDVGVNRWSVQPVRLGEKRTLSEEFLEQARQIGTLADPINVSQELGRLANDIAIREQAVIDYMRWSLLIGGEVNLTKKDGTIINAGRIQLNTATVGTAWNDRANSKPLSDLAGIRNSNLGFFDFGQPAMMVGRSKSFDNLLFNTNALDLGKVRLNYGQTIVSVNQINALTIPFNVPKFVVCDDGYVDNAGVFQPFIPEGKFLIIGAHHTRGTKVGNWVNTRNASLNGKPGIYAASGMTKEAPILPWIERGRNGGVRLDYVRQTIVLTAYTP